LCAGDFNEILRQEEQFGQNSRNENQMMAFRDCLADCRLADLGYSGYSFTWDNRRDGEANVQARLDRATATAEFLQLFPHTAVEHIVTEESDHAALLIKVRSNSDRLSHKPRGFMYEEMWTKHEQYDELVTSAWEDGQGYRSNLSGLWSRLHDVSKELKKWSFDVFGTVCQQIKKLRSAIAEAKTNALASGSSLDVRELEKQLHVLFEQEEIMYKRRSRQDWIKYGDKNTKYFQNRATHRRRKNTVKFLVRDDGTRCQTDDDMRVWAREFYSNLFKSEGATNMDRILGRIETFVSPEMNAALTAAVSDKEIEEALFQMGPTKSLGPDGLPALFFQRHWALLKTDVCSAVRDFLAGNDSPVDFNDSSGVDPESKLPG
jgi:hypothetical protein